LTRGPDGATRLRSLGAAAVVAEALDRDGLLRAVDSHTADAVIHELTALAKPPLRHAGMRLTPAVTTAARAHVAYRSRTSHRS